ncbi:MAG TPA: DUF1761 domain-containing protein [Candidatus Sulfotelmatobacter sp.]|nr:DUF1761 domain-containing protein [Candidatus Sulfotelmatobacter sp.]
MLFLLGLLLFLVITFLILLSPALWGREIYNRCSGSRIGICPENQQQVAVSIDALHAATTGIQEHPDLRLEDCTRWPERSKCDQACLPQALRAEPYTLGELNTGTKRIYHLPVLLAAFAAWYLGAVWHSHYLFRGRWMETLGLTAAQVKQLVLWYSPHLLSVAICLLFAYGVAWLLAISNRRGIYRGILMSLLLWGAVTVATWAGLAALPHDLLMIEASYTALAALLVGAIIGGLTDKLVLPLPMTHSTSS